MRMTPEFLLPYALFWAVLFRTLLVRANILPPTCARCGRKYERGNLGETICSCHR